MTRVDPLRARAQAISGDAFFRVDLKDALYVVAARDEAPFEAAGFAVQRRGALLALSPTQALFPVVRAAYAPLGQDDRLFSLFDLRKDCPVSAFELALFAEGMKLLCGRAANLSDYDKKLRQTAARCLRQGVGGGLSVCRLAYLAALAAQNADEGGITI